MATTALDSFSRDIAAKPQAEQAKAIKEAVDALPEEQKQAVAKALSVRIPDPDQTTSNVGGCGVNVDSVKCRYWFEKALESGFEQTVRQTLLGSENET